MMSRRGTTVWMVHGLIALCGLLILGAMAALTRGVINTEENRARMEMKANEQEQVRLALWRMDTAAAAWIADEAQRPVPDATIKNESKPEVKLRFDAREDGILLADDPDKVPLFCETLGLPSGSGAFPAMCTMMPEIPSSWSAVTQEKEQAPVQQQQQAWSQPQTRAGTAYQQLADSREKANRGKAVKDTVENSKTNFDNYNANGNVVAVGDWSLQRSSLPRPARIANELLLLRHLQWKLPSGRTLRSIQGVWVDEPALKALLLAEIGDLFPGASLIGSNGSAPADDGNTLASFPWKLAAAQMPEILPPLPETVRYP